MKHKKILAEYWLKHYVSKDPLRLCSLCGNTGRIDTRDTTRNYMGQSVGRINYCICPNGRLLNPEDK